MSNTLDRLTVLRFTQAFKTGGGIESYLDDLDQMLLQRNRMKLIRMYLEEDSNRLEATTRMVGLGSLTELPMMFSRRESKKRTWPLKTLLLRELFRDLVVYNPLLYRIVFRALIQRSYPRPGFLESEGAGGLVRSLHRRHHLDLIVLHHLGSIDSSEIIREASELKISYIFINHYSNRTLNNVSIREQLTGAARIAGVTGVGVPKRLRGFFYNVSDGIDTGFFRPVPTRSREEVETTVPTIFHPARITRTKGQLDLVQALLRLRKEGLRARAVFAGRTDSAEYEHRLKQFAETNGLADDVIYLGQLNREEILDWYSKSTVVALPTYHHEGLPRIVIEAQALQVPVVAYDVGGMSEALKHGETGFLVKKGDIKQLTRRLRDIIVDTRRSRQMGDAGRQFVENNFGLEQLAARHEELYLEALRRPPVG